MDIKELARAYRLRWKRRRLLYRAIRKRRQLLPVSDRTNLIHPRDILAASTVRNEMIRLPYFMEYYRRIGVRHFLFVDNDSDDGTRAFLAEQPDVSLWTTKHSYRLSRFGVDWLTWIMLRHAHGHWCLTLDADEIFIFPHHDTRSLQDLTHWLDTNGCPSFGALMLDMYPKGRLSAHHYTPGDDPFETLCWFDGDNYTATRKADLQNLWIQGGVRARKFFAHLPRRAPTMSKTPLVKWNRRYAYVSSTHSLLPRRLNHVFDRLGGEIASGILLHSKFLPVVLDRSVEEKRRKEHFANSSLYDDYYDSVAADPDLWCESSTKLVSWRQLEAMGLMSKGNWL